MKQKRIFRFSQDSCAKSQDASWLDSYSTYTQVHVYVHTHQQKPWQGAAMTYFQAVSLARHEARQTQGSNNERGDKEDWQFFPLLCK